MLSNNVDHEGLFRGAFLHSGSLLPFGDIKGGQRYYDNLVEHAGCGGTQDTLDCLRRVSYERIVNAMNSAPSFFSYQVSVHCVYTFRRLILTGVISSQ